MLKRTLILTVLLSSSLVTAPATAVQTDIRKPGAEMNATAEHAIKKLKAFERANVSLDEAISTVLGTKGGIIMSANFEIRAGKPLCLDQLADPQSRQRQQPPYADNWHRSVKPEYGVLVGICTHLGCIPNFGPLPNSTQPAANWLGGYFCPCHGSKYDLAGRVFRGVPAPYNLPVPPYHFVNETTIRIGENPPGTNFDFSSILQI